jgi:hypothetical protein
MAQMLGFGVVLKEMVIVAIRGTYYLFDWTVNFRMRNGHAQRTRLQYFIRDPSRS